MELRNYIPLLFVFLFFASLVTLPWLGGINTALASSQMYIFYFILMVLLAIMWNIFYYQGLRKEKMIEFQMILLLTPLVTVLLAILFFPEEYNRPVFLAAVVGGLALFFSHVKRHHLEFDKYALHLLLAVILIAMETMVQKELLYVYSPATLYAARTGILALFFAIYYRPQTHKVHDYEFRLVFLSGVLGAFYMITKFIGFKELGVIYTTLILLLVPVLSSWLDAKLYGTEIKRRTIIAFIIILLCVVYATIHQSNAI